MGIVVDTKIVMMLAKQLYNDRHLRLQPAPGVLGVTVYQLHSRPNAIAARDDKWLLECSGTLTEMYDFLSNQERATEADRSYVNQG